MDGKAQHIRDLSCKEFGFTSTEIVAYLKSTTTRRADGKKHAVFYSLRLYPGAEHPVF